MTDFENIKMEKAEKIITNATSLKKSDIGKSIELIKKAVSIFPDNSSYFKLANYLYDANRKEECFETLNELLNKFNYDNFTSNKNMNRCEIFDRKAIIDYKEKDYRAYVLHSCLSLYNWCIGLSIQGRKGELANILEAKDVTEFMTKTKLKKSFENLGISVSFDPFFAGFTKLLNIESRIFINIISILDKTNFSKLEDFGFDETVGEKEDKILLRNKEFNDYYSMFNETKVEKYVSEMI